MGYTSRAVIAVHKTILAEDLISPILPSALREISDGFVETYDTDLARYWVINGWKWYKDFDDIKELEEFFLKLDERRIDIETEWGPESICVFGASRIGEDDTDAENWGDPFEYGIETVRYIDHPKRD